MPTPRTYTYDGKTMTLNEWADFLCMPRSTLSLRLNRGYAPENVFTTASHAPIRLITAFGETHSISEWSRRTGVVGRTLQHRLDNGEDPESALTRPCQVGRVLRTNDKRLDGEHVRQARQKKKAERERAKADRERQKAEQIARRNRIEIEQEGTDAIVRALAYTKAKREQERARIAAIKLPDPLPETPMPRRRPKKPVDLGYQPINDGLFGAFAKVAGVGRSSADSPGTGVGSVAQETAELRFFPNDGLTE